MTAISSIQEAVRQIAPRYPIKRVMLFGSYANGSANADSDVDVLGNIRLFLWFFRYRESTF